MNTSLILTTHYMEEAERLCDFIIIIDEGRILKQGTLDELLEADQGNNKTIEFSIQNDTNSLLSIFNKSRHNIKWSDNYQKGSFQLDQPEKNISEFLAFVNTGNVQIRNLEIRKRTLDDLFISLTGRHLSE